MSDLKHFYTELFKYYMEFLQTDFKSQTGPNRLVTYENKEGLLCDVDLSTYPKTNPLLIKMLHNNFTKNTMGIIKKESYVIKLPSILISSILQAYESNVDIQDIIQKAKVELKKQNITLRDDFLDGFKTTSRVDLSKLKDYLENYNAHSLYEDLFELWKNKMQLEADEFYFYFFDIRYKGATYPLFYMQVSVERSEEGDFFFDFSPTLLINKKAIEFVINKYSKEINKSLFMSLPTRQIYTSDFSTENSLSGHIQNSIINDLCSVLGISSLDVLSLELSETQNSSIQITNTCYISLADKSDESLLNDYEELHQLALKDNDEESLNIFRKIGEDFLYNNPQTFESIIEEEYNALSLAEKLSYQSPIPLNKEQQLILDAIDKESCDRIIVEGPPGTGKSHTIVSIVFNALLKRKSVLVVSDTKEALDVVESKINDVLVKIDLNEKMENPILRLGKRETNFNNIYNPINFGKIKNRHSSYKSLSNETLEEINNITTTIKSNIDQEIKNQQSITPDKLQNLVKYEKYFIDNWMEYIDIDEIKNSTLNLEKLWKAIQIIIDNYNALSQEFNVSFMKQSMNVIEFSQLITQVQNDITNIEMKIKKDYSKLIFVEDIDTYNIHIIETSLQQLESLRLPIVNTYWFKGKQIKQIEFKMRETFFHSNFPSIINVKDEIEKELLLYKQLQKLNEKWLESNLDFFTFIKKNRWSEIKKFIHNILEAIEQIQLISSQIPKSFNLLGFDLENIHTLLNSKLVEQNETDIQSLIEYIETYFNTLEGSVNSIGSSYNDERNLLQKRLIFKMTNILDESVVAFRENFKNDSEEIRRRVRGKKKLTKDSLEKLVKAFPCLIVGIRELGEFLPLAPNLFDIVIIDEASQVNIAQAFPAIIRGKKVVVLGDQRQFTNFKSHHVNTAVNNTFFNQVKEEFAKSIISRSEEEQDTLLFKLNSFNIKTSILDFIRNITNYQSGLKKHFRGYMELIGYSNKNFYRESLQVMKIRGVDIQEVIKFHVLTEVSERESKKNINKSEADFILKEIIKLKNEGFQGSVGIITPFAHQHKYITDLFYSNENQLYFSEHFQLKIMTFDSCQGEERDIIFYSMVERQNEDNLKGIFLLQFGNLDNEELNSKNATRLNVGLSRAKESVRFVLSKQPESIRGEVGNALRYFKKVLEQPLDNVATSGENDTVLFEYIKKTAFYKSNEEDIELVANYDIHQYIKQLDPRTVKQKFKTYALMTVKNGLSKAKTAIIEYDCFDESLLSVRQDDIIYDKRFVESEIENRKTIESYGYPFFRVNKFLIDIDPEAEELNRQFENVLKKK
ncbi:hypothetical protein BK143_11585 [Paenibacillus peoriae]|uniref:AAA domain-containing protein n=1 Tax=Paenibacillus peoriae TaxID=59893 RepID=UPI00096E203B|nr:AAA domain-containing protein [Paenibacillus peoriae]OMF72872.1 hypothetical protein BK143_11585 [Paenibacillus peoriae]